MAKKIKYNPTSIRLKDLKPPLQEEAMSEDRSLNWLVCKILKVHVEKKLKDVKK